LLPVSIVRDGERREVSLRLAERPEPDV
jgi:hypothetical protein